MKLTRTERWMLVNQHRILEALYPKEKEYHKNACEALENGYELEYDGLCENIYKDADTMTLDECKEVVDILAMFDALKQSYKSLKDKSGVEEGRTKFLGFDGNNESKQMAYARFFCTGGSIKRFSDLDKGDNFNSHMPTLSGYRNMLREWKPTRTKFPLSKDDIVRIAAVAY